MISDRSGKVDVSVACLVDGDTIEAFKRPQLARINEIVGSYALGLPQMMAAFHVSHNLSQPEIVPLLPSAMTRIRVGAAINSLAIPLVVAAGFIAT